MSLHMPRNSFTVITGQLVSAKNWRMSLKQSFIVRNSLLTLEFSLVLVTHLDTLQHVNNMLRFFNSKSVTTCFPSNVDNGMTTEHNN